MYAFHTVKRIGLPLLTAMPRNGVRICGQLSRSGLFNDKNISINPILQSTGKISLAMMEKFCFSCGGELEMIPLPHKEGESFSGSLAARVSKRGRYIPSAARAPVEPRRENKQPARCSFPFLFLRNSITTSIPSLPDILLTPQHQRSPYFVRRESAETPFSLPRVTSRVSFASCQQ